MRPLRIALADLAHGNNSAQNLYVPLNVGYLASYAKARFGRDISIKLFKDANALLESGAYDLVGLSFYYWNAELNTAVMQALRAPGRKQPYIVVGGPCIDSDAEEQKGFLRKHFLADAIV